MKKADVKISSPLLPPFAAIAVTVLLAGMRLYELVPITAAPGVSLQNWRVELATSIVLVIGCIWILVNRKAAIERLLVFDKYVGVTLLCLAGSMSRSHHKMNCCPEMRECTSYENTK